MKRILALCLILVAASAWADKPGTIKIKFADDKLPAIDEKVVVKDCGISEEPAMQEAKAIAATELPPPEFWQLELEWTRNHAARWPRCGRLEDRFGRTHSCAGHLNSRCGLYGTTCCSSECSSCSVLNPRPQFNSTLYYAHYEDWKRSRERAIYHELKKAKCKEARKLRTEKKTPKSRTKREKR